MLTQSQVFSQISEEREYQNQKYGEDKQQSFAGFLLCIQSELNEAIQGWQKSISTGRNSPAHEVLQIAALAVACMEKYGTEGCPTSTDDSTKGSFYL